MIKTFRGILGDGKEARIRLSTKQGKIGYKIVKFDLIPGKPGGDDSEFVGKIYKVPDQPANATIDFSDGNLLAAGYINNHTGASYYNLATIIVFDQEVFNQDIYVTMNDGAGADNECNYYVELETFSMTDNAAAVSTLRDIRLNPQVGA